MVVVVAVAATDTGGAGAGRDGATRRRFGNAYSWPQLVQMRAPAGAGTLQSGQAFAGFPLRGSKIRECITGTQVSGKLEAGVECPSTASARLEVAGERQGSVEYATR